MQTTTDFAKLADLETFLPHVSVAGRSMDGVSAPEPDAEEDQAERRDQTSALADQVKAGDRDALRPLLDQVRPRALAIALKVLRNREDAEDAVQEALVKAWRNIDRFEGRASFTTWIHRIVMNTSLDILRRNTSRPDMTVTAEREDDEQPKLEPTYEITPEHTVALGEMQLMVRAAVSRLAPVHQQAINLREFEDCSYEEIAENAGCPVGTVMSRLHHARHRLAEDLLTVDNDIERWAA
jgi:RNA polymerase sigma-70 factor (ECF subfamily)